VSFNLFKTNYIEGIKCNKLLWLRYNNKSALIQSKDSKARFKEGSIVGDLACNLFPGGIEIPFHGTTFPQKIELTKRYLDQGISDIYEATFNYDNILVMVDILHKNHDGSFDIYEVKSSTKVKDIYKHDAAIQYYVLNDLGYNINNVYITILNTDYIRGDELDIYQLFAHEKITDEVLELQKEIPANLNKLRDVLKDVENEPDIDIGKHCKNPYDCDAIEYCWKQQRNIPDYSVFDIFQMNENPKSVKLYKEGVVTVEDIPDDMKLTANQQLKVDMWKAQKDIVNKEAIKEFIDTISYPIYHFDFETLNPAIPSFKGIKPYGKYPFQYSLHIEQENGSLEHKEYLAKPGADPREEIAKLMVEQIPKDACVMAFNIGFEKGIIKSLANQFPIYKEHLMNIYDNFVDLAIPFQKGFYWKPQMQKHYGLKYALPAVVPEMKNAYHELDGVHNGGDAMRMFEKLSETTDVNEYEKIKNALLEYCKLDTYAMVKILEKLKYMSQ